METMAAAIPNSRFEIIEDAPHMIHVEQPRRFSELVNGFVAQHTSS